MEVNLPYTLQDIKRIIKQYPTPFHLYDEARIRSTARGLKHEMEAAGIPDFQNYFAMKALPNPEITKLLAEEGMGVDCSSVAELATAEMCGLKGEQIMFTSNNTLDSEFEYAVKLGAIINFDDLSLVKRYLENNPALGVASCRFNPGNLDFGGENEVIIGSPHEAKYGMPIEDLREAYELLKKAGVKEFGIHTMLLSNDLDWRNHELIAKTVFEAALDIAHTTGISFSFINLGGGIGVPYRPTEYAFDLRAYAEALAKLYKKMNMNSVGAPRIVMENGRYITADAGTLVTTVVNEKRTHKTYVGVDATMSDLMRPGMYGAYHHITVLGKESELEAVTVDVTGSLCENNDKFAIDRQLPRIDMGDILAIHTTGAHGHAMGFQYNGMLRHAELLLDPGGNVRQIRRAETLDDYFSTLTTKGDYHVQSN